METTYNHLLKLLERVSDIYAPTTAGGAIIPIWAEVATNLKADAKVAAELKENLPSHTGVVSLFLKNHTLSGALFFVLKFISR